MYLHYAYIGNNVGVDPTIQKRKQYDKARYQRRKEKQRANANANMEAHTTEGMTQNRSGLTHETNIGKISFHTMFFFTKFSIII